MFRSKFSKSFQTAQPRWSRLMFRIVGLPALLTWGAAVVVGPNGGGLPIWAVAAFGTMFVVVIIQWICFFIYGPAY